MSSMECLEGYTFIVMTSVILSGGVKMRVEHGMLREVYIFCHDFCHTFWWCENEGRAWNAQGGYTFVVMTSVILSGSVKMRAEHGMLGEVYIFCHDPFCSLPGSTFACFSASRENGPSSQTSHDMPKPGGRQHKRITTYRDMGRQSPSQQSRSKQPLATWRLASKRWSAVSRLRRITIID